MWLGRIACLSAAVVLAGCVQSGGTLYSRLQHEDPTVRSRAAIQAGQMRDNRAIGYLIDRLTDAEPAVRMFANISLKKITGESMGFNVYDSKQDQAAAVERWRQWSAKHGKSAGTTSLPGEKTER